MADDEVIETEPPNPGTTENPMVGQVASKMQEELEEDDDADGSDED